MVCDLTSACVQVRIVMLIKDLAHEADRKGSQSYELTHALRRNMCSHSMTVLYKSPPGGTSESPRRAAGGFKNVS